MLAAILAGGLGKRLRPYTDSLPKVLVPINDKPILQYQIEWVRRHGVKRVLILAGYRGEKIVEFLGDGRKFDVEVAYSFEKEPLGTGGALKNAYDALKDEECFLVLNGDVITNIDLGKLLAVRKKHDHFIGYLSLVNMPSPYGIVRFDRRGVIREFVEKPILRDYWINAGVYLLKREVLNYVPNKGDIEKTAFPTLAKMGALRAVKFKGFYWRSIDTHKDVEVASEELKLIKFP